MLDKIGSPWYCVDLTSTLPKNVPESQYKYFVGLSFQRKVIFFLINAFQLLKSS